MDESKPFPQSFNMVVDEGTSDPRYTEMISNPQFTCKPVPTPVVIFENAKTSVFWDIADYPIPIGADPVLFCNRMKDALVNKGYKGELSIYVYVDTGELLPKCLETFVEFDFLPKGDDYARISSMLVDISFWALSYPYSNIIVLSKKIVRDTILSFESLYNTHGLLLSKTEPHWLVPSESSALFLASLFKDQPEAS
ncbi:hypothetical protein Bca4012_103778 [Brassica carinata]|uniref:uncharacterized protein LOC125574810 isoform X1 n=2 Tax=Brassica napus TaxID=3708 RepID=UPI0020787BF1|nr:uncharacterized protein LOC125574810 isoform X1 [Brassica napus]XP_048630592.1 uncharacterized protein LOC125603942 isoform X1 [Brassica napus]